MYPGNVDDLVCLRLGSCPHLNTNVDLLRDTCLVRFRLSHHTALAVHMDFQVITKWRFLFHSSCDLENKRINLGELDWISDCPNEYAKMAHCAGALQLHRVMPLLHRLETRASYAHSAIVWQLLIAGIRQKKCAI